MASNSTQCLCSLESSWEDYVVINRCPSQPRVPPLSATQSEGESSNKQGNSSPGLLRQTYIHMHNFALRLASCCKLDGWTEFPGDSDPEHSIHAHHIFLELSEKIQENRLGQSPPVTKLELKGYKYQSKTTDTVYSQYYYLRIEAGPDFYLYVKVGLTKENYTRISLLRLSSKEAVVES